MRYANILFGDPILDVKFGNLFRNLKAMQDDEFAMVYMLSVLDPDCEDVKELFAHLYRQVRLPRYRLHISIGEAHAVFERLGYFVGPIDTRNLTVYDSRRGWPVCSVQSSPSGTYITVRRPIRGVIYLKGATSGEWFVTVSCFMRDLVNQTHQHTPMIYN